MQSTVHARWDGFFLKLRSAQTAVVGEKMEMDTCTRGEGVSLGENQMNVLMDEITDDAKMMRIPTPAPVGRASSAASEG